MFLDFHRTSKGAFVISADVKVAIGQTENHKRDRIRPKGLLRLARPRFTMVGCLASEGRHRSTFSTGITLPRVGNCAPCRRPSRSYWR
jgi:hypothetical protein